MNPLDDTPVIVGSAMSGLIVSRALSEAGIDHVLIGGDPPNDAPRLGESLNECAGPAMWRWFGAKYPECFFTKSHISLMNGRHASLVSTGDPERNLAGLQRFATTTRPVRLSYFTRGTILHVDRIELDKAVYRDVLADPHCTFVNSLVNNIEYDADEDKIRSLTLENGTVINRPRYVFDATGFRGIVARAANVELKPLSNLQHVVWTHFTRDDDAPCPKVWWRHGTNLLRLSADHDPVAGISWMIPLGNTLSVGVSCDADDPAIEGCDKEQIIEMLTDAYRRRGVDYQSHFPHIKPVQELKHKYYVRQRAYGGNWLLVGGTYLSIWFPTSAGLWTVAAAAGMAPQIIDEPLRFGQKYEQALESELSLHDHMDQLVHGDVFRSQRDVYDFWHDWERDIPQRVYHYLRIANKEPDRRSLRYHIIHTFARVVKRWRRLLVLTPHTNRVRSPAPIDELHRQVDAFPRYFHPRIFAMQRYFPGLWNALTFLFARNPRKPEPAKSIESTESTESTEKDVASTV